MEKIYFKKYKIMKIDLLLIWPNIKYNHWPAKWFKLLIDWLKKNWYNMKVVSWLNISILNIIWIFFTNKIYIVSFNWFITYLISKIFKEKKIIIWVDMPLSKNKLNNLLYSQKNIIKLFNSIDERKYYNYITFNKAFIFTHWININNNLNYENKYDFFIYYKNITKWCYNKTLNTKNKIIKYLKKKNINYNYIEYWKYNYNEWINLLKKTKYWIFITTFETFSYAKVEALNYNIPILNFEQKISSEKNKTRGTFPIFEKWFWELFYNFEEFIEKFEKIQKNKYEPKKIIDKKYCHIKKAKKLYELYNEF